MTNTRLGHLVQHERVLWVLYRGDGRATLAGPLSLQGQFEPGDGADDFDMDFQDALQEASTILASNPGWAAVVSIPRDLLDQTGAVGRACELSEGELEDLRELEMEAPLGRWADPSSSLVLRLQGGTEDAEPS